MDRRAILRLPQWQALAAFVDRWYEERLGGNGVPEGEVSRTEARLGRPLPKRLREWFLLVNHRLVHVNQDRPQRLGELQAIAGRVAIWVENQGNWTFYVDLGDNEKEPSASVEWPLGHVHRATICEVLLGMSYSDTLVGASTGERRGTLGPLRSSVVGGFVDDGRPEIGESVGGLPTLEVFQNPYFDEPLRGDEQLIVRSHGDGMWDWMAATAEAARRAASLFALPEIPGHHV